MALAYKSMLFVAFCLLAILPGKICGQRDENSDDDFDDAGFDDSGYNSPQNSNREADGSSHSPSNYSPASDELDDDDDVDESNIRPQLAQIRHRRSLGASSGVGRVAKSGGGGGGGAQLTRVRRHSKYIGPVYTYVKTDKHARYKWGVKHKVGKHYG